MTIQRYVPTFSEFDAYKGMLPGEDDGYGRSYILFADHQQALSALEARIAELEKALKAALEQLGECSFYCGDLHHRKGEQHALGERCQAERRIVETRDQILAALSPKEPATQQSDHLKQPIRARVDSGA
jgi:hypothetical protein